MSRLTSWGFRGPRCGMARKALFVLLAAWGMTAGFARVCQSEVDDAWRQAEGSRSWIFPRDHGAHPAYRTEWWYFTGNLKDDEGNRYGYQLTFFRQGIRTEPAQTGNPWSVRDLYLAHFTVTDVKSGRFIANERVSRTGPGLAGARTDALDVWLLSWSAREKDGRLHLRAREEGAQLELSLIPAKPLVFHGESGLSRKGDQPGQASYYVSYTRLTTAGFLKTSAASRPIRVGGVSWFDHEFGSNELAANQAGWDWYGLHLSDGRDLMLYALRRADGALEPASSGTIVDGKGVSRHLALPQIRVEVLDHWKSGRSGALYPCRWRIRILSERIDVIVASEVPDQELVTPGSTGITYWEGAVRGEGTSGGHRVSAEGYVELTGYAGRLGGVF